MEEMILNDFDAQVLNLNTLTVVRLIKLGADPLTLYIFYTITAKRQSIALHKHIATIKATESYCMQGLGWGSHRFREAKKTLLNEKLISNIVKKDGKGHVAGYYIQVNYLKQNPVGSLSTEWAVQRVDNDPPNTDNKNINTDNKKENTIENNNSLSTSPTSMVDQLKTSKNSITKMTYPEVYEMAKDLDIQPEDVQTRQAAFFDYIQDPKNARKYKTVYYTVKNWVRRDISTGNISENDEMGKLVLESKSPEELEKKKQLREFAEKNDLV